MYIYIYVHTYCLLYCIWQIELDAVYSEVLTSLPDKLEMNSIKSSRAYNHIRWLKLTMFQRQILSPSSGFWLVTYTHHMTVNGKDN